MTIIDEPSPKKTRSIAAPVDIPVERWVGWMVRPFDGGWKLRRVSMPLHVLEMFATDKDVPANRREIIVASIADEAASPALVTKTEWGTPIGHSPPPPEDEMVEMVDDYTVNALGMRVPVYRTVPRAAYEKLGEEVRANHRLKP